MFERWKENVDVFDLIELNVKLREMFDLLAELDPPMNGRRIIRREILNWKWKLLEIMTNKSMKFGKSTYRMRHEALRHVEFLKKFGEKELQKIWKDFDDKKLEDYHLYWLRSCLQSEPDFGIVKAEEGLKIAKKGVFALAFLDELAKECKFYRHKDFALKVWNALKEFKVESEAEMALKIIAKSSVLIAVYLSAVLSAIKIKPKLNPFEEFERFERECENLKNEYLRSFALGWVLKDWAKILLGYGLLKGAKEKLKKVLDLCNVEINIEGIKDFFKPLGGDPKDKAKRSLDALRASAHYYLGIALIDLSEFDEAIEQFKIAEKLYRKLKIFVEELKCKSGMKRVEILKDWEFGKPIKYDLMEEALKVWHKLDLESKSCLCGEYIVSLALDGYSKKDLEFFEKVGVFTPEHLAMSCGILSLLNSDILKFVLKFEELKKKIGRDLENEGIDFEEEDIRLMALQILNNYDSKMSKGLKDEFERRMRIVENFDEEIRSLKDRGYDEEEAKKILGSDFGGLGLLNFAKKVYEENKREAERLVKLTTIADSPHAFARILLLILASRMSSLKLTFNFEVKDPITDAYNLALAKVEYWTNLKPTLRRLFLNLAEALDKNDEKKLKTAVVKLFYFHV